jgi:hypothetical protein
MFTKLKDLTADELLWLKKAYRRETALLTVDMTTRLKELGVIEQRFGGTGVSLHGKRLLHERYAILIRARRAWRPI